ncbi:MAG: insulinase family protein [Acidobacteria bacterium]|nr:insulinase family protein [Acidobacteriota bacterium]
MPLASNTGWAGTASGASAPASAATATIPEIAYEQFVLTNGLTVLVHEDHKAPIAAVNVWYHVGSKNERRGKTGFAHLFEHLMFNGSEHNNTDYFVAMEKVGATDLNGTTNSDRTNYFQNVPVSALDLALFLESDRMGHLLGAIDQAKLDEQRGVVQNEKRQGENQPYGVARQLLTENTYPVGHPYSWTTIGAMEDLNAASLDDVKEWFRTYYGPNNAVLAIAGDVTVATIREKVETYFGDIPPGPPIAKQQVWVAKMAGVHRSSVQDRVPQGRIYMVWNVPEIGSREAVALDLASSILSTGKTSRLYKRLVYDEQIATDVTAFVWEREIGSQLMIQATVKPGGDAAAVERGINEEIARLLKSGPTADEMIRAKGAHRADFIRGVERIGGFGGTSDVLASNMVYAGDPSFYKKRFEIEEALTREEIRQAASKWISDGVYILTVSPYPELASSDGGVDRSALPGVAQPPEPRFVSYESATLTNGMKVLVARRDGVPALELELLVDAGFAADQGGLQGTASLALEMLDEGTRTRNALQISDTLDRLGATLTTASTVDTSVVSLSALTATLDEALKLYADVILNPAFPQADFDRLQKQRIARIQREKVTPGSMARRVLPALLYGGDHAYGQPLTGSGTEASVASMKPETLVGFHNTWFKPNNATLVVVGDISKDEILPRIEKLFAGWTAGDVPKKNIGEVEQKPAASVYLIDRPGSQQSALFAGHVSPPRNDPDVIATDTMNDVLGGAFVSRINMNLREDKHWSYGAGSYFVDARGQRPFIVYGSVQADKTSESLQEIAKELRAIVGDRPITAAELAKSQANLTLSLPGLWETNSAVADSLADLVRFHLAADYFDTYAHAVRSLSLERVQAAAQRVLHPDRIVWVVVGDRAKIEAGVRALNFGELHIIDADGQPVAAAGSR